MAKVLYDKDVILNGSNQKVLFECFSKVKPIETFNITYKINNIENYSTNNIEIYMDGKKIERQGRILPKIRPIRIYNQYLLNIPNVPKGKHKFVARVGCQYTNGQEGVWDINKNGIEVLDISSFSCIN